MTDYASFILLIRNLSYVETWSEPVPSKFYGTNVTPTLKRLADGRLLFFWANTTSLPEFPKTMEMKHIFSYKQLMGVSEDIFTNRDLIHVAISEDDGKTWKGFRELYLNRRRNDGNYGPANSSGELEGVDPNVQQSQAVELPEGKVLVACGQHEQHRVMLIFDVDWIYEKERYEDFSEGAENVCVFQYETEMVGHLVLNRKIGARVVTDPLNEENKVLKICNPLDSTLVIENQGATWNFPAGTKGKVDLDLYVTDACKGGFISLIDRWFNPVDTTAYKYAMFNLEITPEGYLNGKIKLQRNQWHKIQLSWTTLEKEDVHQCELYIDRQKQKIILPLKNASLHGISYLHSQSRAKEKDMGGFYVDNLSATVE